MAQTVMASQPYESHRIEAAAAGGVLWWSEPGTDPVGVVIVLPGAQMTADRYRWLGDALQEAGYVAVIAEAELEWLQPPGAEIAVAARYLRIPHALAALEFAAENWPGKPVSIIGHSLGGSIALELIDPAEARQNPHSRTPENFSGVENLDSVIVIGSSLQASLPAFKLPYRSDDRPLACPPQTRLLFVAGANDEMATPGLMQATASRYTPAPRLVTIEGANHLQWSAGRGMADRPDYDGEAAIPEDLQQSRTVAIIVDFLAA